MSLCNKIGCLPTSPDYTVNTNGVIELVLAHNLATASDDFVIKRWSSIWPYLIDAYTKDKIGISFLYIFDKSMNSKYGIQYYGFLGDTIPIDKIKLSELCDFDLIIKK